MILCVDFADEGPAEEGDSRPSQRHPAHPEGGHRDAVLTRARQGESQPQTSVFLISVISLHGSY